MNPIKFYHVALNGVKKAAILLYMSEIWLGGENKYFKEGKVHIKPDAPTRQTKQLLEQATKARQNASQQDTRVNHIWLWKPVTACWRPEDRATDLFAVPSGLVAVKGSLLSLWSLEHLLMGMVYWNGWFLTEAPPGSYLHHSISWTEINRASIFHTFDSEQITVVQAKRCCKWEQKSPRPVQPKAEGVSLLQNGRRMSQRDKELGKKGILQTNWEIIKAP